METNIDNIQYEQKDSIKITKNTKGYNYEFKIVAKEGVDLLSQIDETHKQLEQRIISWTNKTI